MTSVELSIMSHFCHLRKQRTLKMMENKTTQNTMWNISYFIYPSLSVAMIANTIDAAPRRPAQEITRYCPIGGFDGASSKPTAGRATNVKTMRLRSTEARSTASAKETPEVPVRKQKHLHHTGKRIKEANQRFLVLQLLISEDNTGQIHT